MGKFSRDKGARTERNIVNDFQEQGFAAERVPLSGAAGGKFAGDISIPFVIEQHGSVKAVDWVFEVKQRASGFKQLYEWLADHDGLIVGRDHSPKLAVIPLWKLQQLMKAAEHARPGK